MKLITLKTQINHKARAGDFVMIDADMPDCHENSVIVRTAYVSLDPYVGSRIRGRHMGEAPPTPMRDAIPGAIVGQVTHSRSSNFKEGEWIHSMEGGWCEFLSLKADHCRKIDSSVAPLNAHIGVLGMPGLTAWAGVSQLAKIREDDIFLVDAAAGPVGGTAGQIARILGAKKVVGIAGGQEKCSLVTDMYGFDACIDYKQDGWQDMLKTAVPDGVSAFFENVSAEMAMIALANAQLYARGVLCGLVGAYHTVNQSQHPLNAGMIIGKRAQLSGLVVYDFYPRWDEYVDNAAEWLKDGRLKFAEDNAVGLENAPDLFEKLLDGKNIGKCIVTVSPEDI